MLSLETEPEALHSRFWLEVGCSGVRETVVGEVGPSAPLTSKSPRWTK